MIPREIQIAVQIVKEGPLEDNPLWNMRYRGALAFLKGWNLAVRACSEVKWSGHREPGHEPAGLTCECYKAKREILGLLRETRG